MGRWLDAEGKLPKPWLDGYKDEATMVELWDIALAEAIKAKGNVVQCWSGENEAQAGFSTNGAEIGLCWDSTGYNLRNDGYGYIAPKEGAFAWNQGFVLMKNANNVEQAHEFAKWVSTPKARPCGRPPSRPTRSARARIDLMDPEVAEFYNAAFTTTRWRSCGGGRTRRPGSSPSAANTPTSTRPPDRSVSADLPEPPGCN